MALGVRSPARRSSSATRADEVGSVVAACSRLWTPATKTGCRNACKDCDIDGERRVPDDTDNYRVSPGALATRRLSRGPPDDPRSHGQQDPVDAFFAPANDAIDTLLAWGGFLKEAEAGLVKYC